MSKINKLIWIDDSERCMKEVVANVFMDLWKNDIRSDILIIGDDDDKDNNIDHTAAIADLNRVTYDKFISFLISEGFIENENSVKLHWPLINNQEDIMPESDVASEHMSVLYNNISVINKWKLLGESININDEEYSVNKIADDILSLISDMHDYSNIVIMLDLCLIEGDYKKLSFKDSSCCNIPVLSMALYNALKKKDIKIGLYSTYVVPNDVVIKWEKTYKSLYDNDAEVNIFNRKGELLFLASQEQESTCRKQKEKLIDYILRM